MHSNTKIVTIVGNNRFLYMFMLWTSLKIFTTYDVVYRPLHVGQISL